jgi:hypothetical protein
VDALDDSWPRKREDISSDPPICINLRTAEIKKRKEKRERNTPFSCIA